MFVAPRLVVRLWWGDREPSPSATAIMRSMGARDAVIGAGTALAADGHGTPWLRAGIAADLADLGAAVLAGGRLPGTKRAATIAFAAAGAIGGLLISRASS